VASESTIINDAPAAHFARHGVARRSPTAVVRAFINLSLIEMATPQVEATTRRLPRTAERILRRFWSRIQAPGELVVTTSFTARSTWVDTPTGDAPTQDE